MSELSGKRRRFMRNKNSREPRLTPEDIEYLRHNTRYDEKEIREWFR